MYQHILSSIKNRTLIITINRESKMNALNMEVLNELNQVFTDALNNAAIGGIIITGAGTKAFIAGADIEELKDLDPSGAYNLATNGHSKVFNLIAQSEKPVIAAINGYALGGGLELALACHIRIASLNSKLGLPEVSLGLIPGYGGTQRLPQLIGRARALEIILTGEMISAPEAFEIGLVNYAVEAEELINKAVEIMDKILTRSATAVSAAIRAVNASSVDNGYETEIAEFAQCFRTPDFEEGTSAFLQKRPPNFIK